MFERVKCLIRSTFVSFVIAALAGAVSSAQTEILFWGPQQASADAALQELVEEFNTAHPDIHVTVLPLGSLGINEEDRLIAAIAGGTAPDLIWFNRVTVPRLAASGAFLPLDEFMAGSDVLDPTNFFPEVLAEGTFQGRIYGVPIEVGTFGFVWNRDHFARAGLDTERPPSTWEAMRSHATKLTETGADGSIEQLGLQVQRMTGRTWLYTIAAQQGVSFVTDDGRTVRLDDPGMVEALEWTVETIDLLGGWERTRSVRPANLPGGKVSMDPTAGVVLVDRARDSDINIGVGPAPIPPGGRQVAYIGGWALAVPSGIAEAKQPAVVRLMEFLLETENQVRRYLMSPAAFPVTPDAVREVSRRLSTLPSGRELEGFLQLTSMSVSRGSSPINIDILQGLEDAALAAVTKEAAPLAALRSMSRELQEMLDAIVE